jgi:hypothetical protein
LLCIGRFDDAITTFTEDESHAERRFSRRIVSGRAERHLRRREVRTWANVLGKNDIAGQLEDTLEEEKDADQSGGGSEATVGLEGQEGREGQEGQEGKNAPLDSRISRPSRLSRLQITASALAAARS